MSTIKISVKTPALAESLGMAPGEIVAVECKRGVPINREWRNRLKDSTIDGCVEMLVDAPVKSKTPKKREGK